ncbi:carboxypeptidase regulatory-like domain-containing protein [Mucilaginibacter sp. KACC 22773]|uniref:TonB-dependent receptor n=1 Tax=Mucilaginibacter sp. KACC 22773 TaxID=3025671 RepID=UPI002366168C|nr:carboxypeptidase regulatory-like domain-containing protein [Mucilaginibacter sp. KACC 22773]WDF76089.1 carboxypeptidase regulatory-like domain-containing protein [Mucilaginibacter sp. KACC 22773]
MRKHLLLLLLLTGFTFLINRNAAAQGVTTASINGIVTDAKGAIPGATVTITHVPTGTVYATVSRSDGRFNIPNLRVGGPYTFKVSFIGYKTFQQDNITLSIGQDQKLSAALEDNTATLGEVKVTASGSKVINSSRTGARETISRQQIESLPTINRSLSDFTKLTPSANGLSFGGRSSGYNNITVDGALFNNSFGLSGTLGGQTSSQPISLDAIDQIQVDIAPYDVRQGNFTGAGVNTVVKSGTNEFKGTVYDYIRSTGLTGYHAGVTDIVKTPFNYHQDGLSIGGPIIKNKLFFFLSGEQERISAPATAYVAAAPGVSGATVSQADAATLNSISDYLKSKYSYDPGAYQGYSYTTHSDKITVKLDWNINKNNTLSAKYFYLKSYKDQPASNSGIVGISNTTRAAGVTTLPFYGSGYRINNNFNIGIIELDTRISNSFSNRLTAGYSALRDYRASLGGAAIPMVDIGNGVYDPSTGKETTASAVTTSFGYELFTANNLLSTNILQFSDDLTWYKGKHEVTIGITGQAQRYTNGFAPNYNGLYTYNSAYDFLNGLPATQYSTRNSALPDGSFPYAKINASIYSAYIQDKWHVTDNLRVTYGLRADYDVFPTTLQQNANVPPLTFQGGMHVDPSVLPKNRVQLSPRLGFNYDVFGDGTTQLRGGTGLFAGTVPFVWISNQASNNGVLFGSYSVTKAATPNDPRLIFNPNVNANRPAAGAGVANTSYELDIADPKLKYPKIWRSNLAIDQRLPGGIIATLEGSYTKDVNAIYHQNLVLSDGYSTLAGAEGQIRYDSKNTTPAAAAATAANPSITGLYYMTNTSKGYSYFVTAQLQKSFSNGLYANVAYTHTGSKDVNDGGSTASTIWSTRYVAGNPNADNLSNSSYVQPNRVIASFSYKHEYFKHAATTIGLIFEAANNGAVSYITSGDPNGDGATNDLMFIPKNKGDITLVPNDAKDLRTADQLWSQLNNFINQDPYLSKHRGEYAQRNGAILPTFKRADLHIAQDFFVTAGKVKNTIEISLDIINIGNLLNRNWGVYQNSFTGFSNGSSAVTKYMGTITNAAGQKQATYSFPYLDATNLVPLQSSYKADISQASRWQAQLGLRYIFN